MLNLRYTNVRKYCEDCYILLNNDIYIKLPHENMFAWWRKCGGCRLRL